MRTTATARRSTGLLAVTVLVAVGLAGCGSGDTKAACDKVQAEIANITSQGMTATSNPASLKTIYDNGATKLRELAKGTSISSQTEQVASAMEKLGQQVADFAANPTTTMPQLDTAGITNAGIELKKACS